MHPRLELRWSLDETVIDPRLIELLRGVADKGSLQGAITRARMSYRHAWGTLGRIENALGERLVLLERGRGARLTPLGMQLVAAADAAAVELAPYVRRVEAALARQLAESRLSAAVVVYASHDLALQRLRDRLQRSRRFRLDLHFHGSLDCLAALQRGQCDVAGFHLPDTATPGLLQHFRPWLKDRTLRVLHIANRQQGLLVRHGNPLRLEKLHDLTRTRARFVNRQPGSGTRLCFDHLLAASRIRPGQINGYQREEFTHAAVAATVASGVAQAGFGIEAAAREQGLDFVPIIAERYFLAARAAAWARPGPTALLAALRVGALKAAVGTLPGYVLQQSLDLVTVQDAFGTR
jgi:putative molybdopterin biosynthesis protein